VSIPLSLYISASGTRRCERYAWSASPGNLRRAQFTLLSLKGTSPYTCAVREPQNCTHSRHKNRLSFGQRAASPPAMSLWPQQDALLDVTVVSESVRLVAVQRCVDIRGLCRRHRGRERHKFCERPNTASGATDVRQSACKRNAVERSGIHLWVISRRSLPASHCRDVNRPNSMASRC
jgi:hypothetical protein